MRVDNLEAILTQFVTESTQRLDELEKNLLALENDGENTPVVINRVFRMIHTIKGNAMVVHQGEIEWFAHVAESVLVRLREGALQLNHDLISVLLACCDHLRFLLSQVNSERLASPDFADADRACLIGLLVPYLGDDVSVSLPENLILRGIDTLPPPTTTNCWHLQLRFSSRVLQHGLDPLNFLRHLADVGRIVSLQVSDEDIPPLDQYDPECCYLRFEVRLESAADRQTIEDVFAFVREDCDLHLTPPRDHVEGYVERIESLPDDLHTGEMLMRVGALTPAELAHSLRLQRSNALLHRPIGSILVDAGMVAPEVVNAVLHRQSEIKETVQREQHMLHVPMAQLDQLAVMLDGVMNSLDGLAQRTSAASTAELMAVEHAVEKTRRHVETLRSTRFGEQFRYLHRMVRDTANELGKRADLLVAGPDVTIDRSTAALVYDAIMHLLRNAIDHGLESPVQRRLAGKPVQGTISVQASEDKDWLTFVVSDDGAGIDLASVRSHALSCGLLKEGDTPSVEQLYALLFEPGFSTATGVTHYSGRGIGLDVVREAVHALNGEIELASRSGRGTRFRIRVPRSPSFACTTSTCQTTRPAAA